MGSTRNTRVKKKHIDEPEKVHDKQENEPKHKDEPILAIKSQDTEKSSGKGTGKEVSSTRAANAGKIRKNGNHVTSGWPLGSKENTRAKKTQNDTPEKDKHNHEDEYSDENEQKLNYQSHDTEKRSGNGTGKKEVRTTSAPNPLKIGRNKKGQQSGSPSSSKQNTKAKSSLVDQWVTIHKKHCQDGNCSITNQTIPLIQTKIVDTDSLLLHAKKSTNKNEKFT